MQADNDGLDRGQALAVLEALCAAAIAVNKDARFSMLAYLFEMAQLEIGDLKAEAQV